MTGLGTAYVWDTRGADAQGAAANGGDAFFRPRTAWEFPDNLGEYLADLYHGFCGANENVKFRHGAKGYSRYLGLLSTDGRPDAGKFRIAASQFTSTDTFFHPNTFVPCGRVAGNAARSSLYQVYAFAIDVDYRNSRTAARGAADLLGAMSPLAYAMAAINVCLKDSGLPFPNYVEYGRNARLIYILDEPVYARSAQGGDILKKLERFQRHVVDAINQWDACAHAETQGFEKGFRVPGSINGKDLSVVRVHKVHGAFRPFEELFDYLPPAMPKEEFLRRKKEIAKRKRKGVSAAASARQAKAWEAVSEAGARIAKKDGWPARRQDLPLGEAAMLMRRLCALLAARGLKDVRREEMAFIYTVTYRALFGPDESALSIAHGFNEGFEDPLPWIEVERKLKNIRKCYRFRDETVAAKTGIPEEFLAAGGVSFGKGGGSRGFFGKGAKRGAYRLTRKKAGSEAKAEEKKKRRGRPAASGAFGAYFAMGMGAKDVAEKIGCSVRTAFRKLAEWRRAGGASKGGDSSLAMDAATKGREAAARDLLEASGKAMRRAAKANDGASLAQAGEVQNAGVSAAGGGTRHVGAKASSAVACGLGAPQGASAPRPAEALRKGPHETPPKRR